MLRWLLLLALGLSLSSCSISREIRVVWRGGQLVIDFPWSFWRLIGRQDRDYTCVRGVELFDERQVLWSLKATPTPSQDCVDAFMPIVIGRSKDGFVTSGRAFLQRNRRYGISVESYAPARVDFVVKKDGIENIANWKDQMEAPCGTYFGRPCGQVEMHGAVPE